jgi:colicin import membrane protein
MTAKKNTKTGQFEKIQNEEILNVVSGLTVESSLKTLSATQAAIGKTLAGVGEQLQAQLGTLETVTKAVELKKQELETIHGVEVLAKNMEELEEDYKNRSIVLQNLHQEFINTLEATKANYSREHSQIIAKQKSDREHAEADFQYQFAISKRSAQDSFQDELRNLQKAERDRRENLEKQWSAREEEIKRYETEYANMQKQVIDFPNVLKGEVDKQVAIAANSVKRDYVHQIELLKKDAEVAQRMSENTISTLRGQLEAANSVISDLQIRLGESDKKVESIANKALDAASGRQALAELSSLGRENGAISSRKT